MTSVYAHLNTRTGTEVLSRLCRDGGGEAKACSPTILDKINGKPRPPLPPNQGWENGAFLPFARLHPWFGGDGGLLFHFILSKIVGLEKRREERKDWKPLSRLFYRPSNWRPSGSPRGCDVARSAQLASPQSPGDNWSLPLGHTQLKQPSWVSLGLRGWDVARSGQLAPPQSPKAYS